MKTPRAVGTANLFVLVAAGFLSLATAHAHEGHEHAPQLGDAGAFTGGPVELTDTAISNLGVETVEAEIVELRPSVQLVAQVEPLPENVAQITPRFEGTVGEILVKLGETVKAGQPLLRVVPRTIGNPDVVLKSPLDGAVTAVNVTLGQAFSPDAVLMVVGDYSKVLARGTAYENPEVLALKIGDPATLTVDVFPGHRFDGAIQRSDVGLESESKTFEVYALIDNHDGKLRPNLLGQLSVGVGKAQSVLAVPEKAILGDLGNLFVFVRDGKVFEKRPARLGIRSGGQVEILEGVFPGEQVVTRGNYQLQFATSAAAKKPEAAAPAGEPAEPGFLNRSLALGVAIGIALTLVLALLMPRRRAA
ncbi:MAG: efflux RND transporter periplasmic adaptor subunit [Terrimicrobiaceae bacterium]|nr:efflux RND transporter periplasmic adaptor subunit [Terrimicrobiaceae bacterium]